MVEQTSRVWLWLAFVVFALAIGLIARRSQPQFEVLATVVSPDGINDAVLLEERHDAHGNDGFRVCLKWHNRSAPTLASCAGIVYLSAPISAKPAVRIALAWTSAQQLEVRYSGFPNISPVRTPYDWRSGRPPRLPFQWRRSQPISTKLVHLQS